MNKIDLIGEFELTYAPDSAPALLIHHVVRGRDVAALDRASVDELRDLLATVQKRIRRLPDGHQAIFGAGGDVALYAPDGQRACYFNPDQAQKLARFLATG